MYSGSLSSLHLASQVNIKDHSQLSSCNDYTNEISATNTTSFVQYQTPSNFMKVKTNSLTDYPCIQKGRFLNFNETLSRNFSSNHQKPIFNDIYPNKLATTNFNYFYPEINPPVRGNRNEEATFKAMKTSHEDRESSKIPCYFYSKAINGLQYGSYNHLEKLQDNHCTNVRTTPNARLRNYEIKNNSEPTNKESIKQRQVNQLVSGRPNLVKLNHKSESISLNHKPCLCIDGYNNHLAMMEKVLLNLYNEEIPPSIEEIRRRLEKLKCCSFLSFNCFEICKMDKLQRFKLEMKENEGFIYLRDKPKEFEQFIDPNSLNFPYPIDLIPVVFIHLVDRYKSDPKGESYKGGRFLLAELLKSEGPYALRVLTQGKLCHLLQKCLDLGFLSYEDNAIRPAVACSTRCRAYHAKNKTKFNPEIQAREIEQFKTRLKKFLEKYPTGLAMCRLPVMYKKEYNAALEVESFGFTKLADLLETLASDICTIKPAAKHRCIVVPKMDSDSDHLKKPLKAQKEGYWLLNGKYKSHEALTTYLIDILRTNKWSRLSTFCSWYIRTNGTSPNINKYVKSEYDSNILFLKMIWNRYDKLKSSKNDFHTYDTDDDFLTRKGTSNLIFSKTTEPFQYKDFTSRLLNFTSHDQFTFKENYSQDILLLPEIKSQFLQHWLLNYCQENSTDTFTESQNVLFQPLRNDKYGIENNKRKEIISGIQLPLKFSCVPAEKDQFKSFLISNLYTQAIGFSPTFKDLTFEDLKKECYGCATVYSSLFEEIDETENIFNKINYTPSCETLNDPSKLNYNSTSRILTGDSIKNEKFTYNPYHYGMKTLNVSDRFPSCDNQSMLPYFYDSFSLNHKKTHPGCRFPDNQNPQPQAELFHSNFITSISANCG